MASTARVVATACLLLFAVAAGYVDWQDYKTGDEWPILKPLLVLGLVAVLAGELFMKEPEPEETTPAEG